ncbi:4'-phosphopantetheinyl transferase superfamily protein [Polaromonas hydrogenivorans]
MKCAVDALGSWQALTVISVAMPATTDRSLARELVRTALCETLVAYLGPTAASLKLVSCPGQALRLDCHVAQLSVSLSHAPGFSLAAIGRQGRIGVDVMAADRAVEAMPDWADVARDYLGPAVTAWLQGLSPVRRPLAFAQAWTRLEACLKCQAMALTEWTPAVALQLAPCSVSALALPENYRGAIAIAIATDSERVA